MKQLRKLFAVISACLMCITAVQPIAILADENVEHTDFVQRPVDMYSYYELEGQTIKETTSFTDPEGHKVTIIQVITPNNELNATILRDSVVVGSYQVQNANYLGFYNLYMNQYLPAPLCNLDDNNYRHSFTDSMFEEYPHSDVLDAINLGVSGVSTLIGAFLGGLPGATLGSIASWLYSLWQYKRPYATQIIVNFYDVFYKSSGAYYTECWHINNIYLDSGGHVVSGGGMTYVQPLL